MTYRVRHLCCESRPAGSPTNGAADQEHSGAQPSKQSSTRTSQKRSKKHDEEVAAFLGDLPVGGRPPSPHQGEGGFCHDDWDVDEEVAQRRPIYPKEREASQAKDHLLDFGGEFWTPDDGGGADGEGGAGDPGGSEDGLKFRRWSILILLPSCVKRRLPGFF
jgi:hypothetical protein